MKEFWRLDFYKKYFHRHIEFPQKKVHKTFQHIFILTKQEIHWDVSIYTWNKKLFLKPIWDNPIYKRTPGILKIPHMDNRLGEEVENPKKPYENHDHNVK